MRVRLALILIAGGGTLALGAADPFAPLRESVERQAEESLARLTAAQSPRRMTFTVRWAKPRQAPAPRPVWTARWARPGFARRPPRTIPPPALARILEQEGAPARLLSVAEVESGFDPLALSPKGARGLWQFIPETARRFGLRVDAFGDDRVDPVRSTRAAARYLNFLHGLFGDWPLALAAYNAGENRVSRAIEEAGARDFYELSRRGLLPEETRQYVPKVLRGMTWRKMEE